MVLEEPGTQSEIHVAAALAVPAAVHRSPRAPRLSEFSRTRVFGGFEPLSRPHRLNSGRSSDGQPVRAAGGDGEVAGRRRGVRPGGGGWVRPCELCGRAGEVEVGVSGSGSAVQGGRGLRLRLFGFPVHFDLSFVVIMGLLGYNQLQSGGVRDLVIWLVVATLSVLIHELGHAVVARTTGASPEIALTGFGGVTTFVPPRQLSRLRSLAISLAGPVVGLVVGAGLLGLYVAFSDSLWAGSWQRTALQLGIFTCLGWSVINLLPVLPLDGGQAMRELLPGPPEVRARRAAMVSVAAVVPVVVLAFWLQQLWIGLFFVFFGVSNLLSLRQPSGDAGSATGPGTGPGGGAGRTLSPEQAVVALLWQGAPVQARRTMEELPPGTPIDLAVHGAVMALTGEPAQGFALLHQELARRPADPNVAALLVLARALGHDWDGLDAELRGPAGALVPATVLARAAQEATSVGRADVASRISVPRPPRPS